MTAEERTDNRYHYKLGSGKVEKYVKKMFSLNRIYYASNDVGSFVDSYLKFIQKLP